MGRCKLVVVVGDNWWRLVIYEYLTNINYYSHRMWLRVELADADGGEEIGEAFARNTCIYTYFLH